MSIVEDYAGQHRWRSWHAILDVLPELNGQLVLDFGCGIGDLAADLSSRGAHVIGFDINAEFVAFANDRRIPNAEFRVADLRTFRDPFLRADGILSSFTAAYFPSLCDTVSAWIDHLRPGGWLALTEIDNLFGHQPTSIRTIELLDRYVQDSIEHSRRCNGACDGAIQSHLTACGFFDSFRNLSCLGSCEGDWGWHE